MRRATFLVLLLIGLAFTLAACTSYPRHRYPYPDYRGGGDYYGFEQIRGLADDLEEATDRVYDSAKDTSHHNTDREDYALDGLRDLHEEAKDFQDEVDDHSRDPRATRDDYRELLEAYSRARDSLRILHAYEDVYREFERVTRIMAQLNRVYGGRDSYGYGYPGIR